ncbi:MAG: HNH endonuclease signature motif containing protein [Methanogenium sp.]|jgi:hypothetical protein
MTPELEWFYNCIDIKGPNDCWKWISDKSPQGYGAFKIGRFPELAHRKMWTIVNGEIPKLINGRKALIRHKCGNRLCVNPSHLLLGDYSDNARDSHREGKRVKFKKEDVVKIRFLRSLGETYCKIGREFGFPPQTIRRVVLGKGIYSEM